MWKTRNPLAKPGDQWYELQAHRAVNQALFRVFFLVGGVLRLGGDWKDNGDMTYWERYWENSGKYYRNMVIWGIYGNIWEYMVI